MIPINSSEHCATQANAFATKAETFADRFEKGLADRTANIDKAFSKLDLKDREERRQELIEKARHDLFREIDSDPEYRELVREAGAFRANVREANDFYGDPQRLAELSSIDDPRRAQYSATIRGAGHAALKTLAVKAEAERNLPLAMALGQEIAPMKVKDRPFDSSKLIEKCLPESDRKHVAHFRAATMALNRVEMSRNRITFNPKPYGGASSLSKIRAGLAARDGAK